MVGANIWIAQERINKAVVLAGRGRYYPPLNRIFEGFFRVEDVLATLSKTPGFALFSTVYVFTN